MKSCRRRSAGARPRTADLIADGPPLVIAAIKEIAREAAHLTFQHALNR